MADDGKDAYRSTDIQGDVLPGFKSRRDETFHQRFLLARIIGEPQEARAGLCRLLDEEVISTGRDVAESRANEAGQTFVNVAFTATGLTLLGRPRINAVLTSGLAGRTVAKDLLGDPAGWRIGGPGPGVDVVINIGAPELDPVEKRDAHVRELLGAAYAVAATVDGAMLPEGREHFGFKDGLAQPFVSDDPAAAQPTLSGAPAPADGALWPNWDAIRLTAVAEQAKVRAETAKAELDAARSAVDQASLYGAGPVSAAATQRLTEATIAADQLEREAEKKRQAADLEAENAVVMRSPGVPMRPTKQFVVRDGDEFTQNGSFMVWLQLEQRPDAFWAMCRRLATTVQAAFGGTTDAKAASALLVGRTVDGDALEPHPPNLAEDFGYYADPVGRTCPAGAHVRLTNPRDLPTANAMILRRGIPYGPTPDDPERGLIFVCYQADIERQYERLQGEFANAKYKAGQKPSSFPDALISQRGRSGGSTIEIAAPDGHGSVGARLNNTWVIPRGGLYLFAPSMAGLRMLAGSGEPRS